MNRKLVALALVLLLAVGGVFAFDYGSIGTVEALLKANIGEFVEHGFLESDISNDYQPTKTIYNAFITDPVFIYGYNTNAQGRFVFKMQITDFVLSGQASGIKIGSVKKNNVDMTKGIDGFYTLFDLTNESYLGDSPTHSNAIFKISPAKEAVTGSVLPNEHIGPGSTAPAGAYTSTITISVSGS